MAGSLRCGDMQATGEVQASSFVLLRLELTGGGSVVIYTALQGDESEPPSFSHVVVAVPSESAHLPPAPLKTESVQTKSGNSTRRMLAR